MVKKCNKLGKGQHFDDFIIFDLTIGEPIRVKRIFKERAHYLFVIRMVSKGRIWVCGAIDETNFAQDVFPFALPLEVAKQYELGIKLKL